MGDFWKGENLMIVTNLRSSFNPCPKNPVKKEKKHNKNKAKVKKVSKSREKQIQHFAGRKWEMLYL